VRQQIDVPLILLRAAWPDTKPGLDALRALDPPVLLATLSNGTLRLLIDIVRPSLPLSHSLHSSEPLR